jgi:hypothetical protein
MPSFNFDYELTFDNTFDQSIIDNADIPDKSAEFIASIQQEFGKISSILAIYPGVNMMSTFTTFDTKVYKITVKTL